MVVDQAAGLRRQMTQNLYASPQVPRSRQIRVIAISSGKGGVGKTNIAVNLSMAMTQLKKRVLLMDADLGLANVDVMLGLKSQFNLAHVLDGKCDLRDAMTAGPGGLMVIPAASGVARMASLSSVETSGLIHSFNEIADFMDVMVIDTGAGIAPSVLNFCRAAQEVLVVVCDEPASITDAYALIKSLSRGHQVSRFQVIANMVRSEAHGQSLFEKLMRVTDQFLDVQLNYLGSIPFSQDLRDAVQKQSPVVLQSPKSEIAKAFKRMAKKIDAWPLEQRTTGHVQFFLERLLTH
jgi:flagellar biosynthesis protein FlhG